MTAGPEFGGYKLQQKEPSPLLWAELAADACCLHGRIEHEGLGISLVVSSSPNLSGAAVCRHLRLSEYLVRH